MLIDFTVENYKSIKEPVTLSMIASSRKTASAGKERKRRNIKSDDEIAAPYSVEERQLNLLPVIGIFGANASGKSNVIQAVDDLILFLRSGSHYEANLLTWVTQFRLSGTSITEPTRFELRVIRDKTIFIYSLAFTRTRILQEKLEYITSASQKAQTRLIFNRAWHEGKDVYIFKNGKDFGNAYREIQESLRESEPFMSLLTARLNVKIVEPFTDWLTDIFPAVTPSREQYTLKWASRFLESSETELKKTTQMIQRFDTGIIQIDIEKSETDGGQESEEFKVWVWHEAEGKRVRWLIQEESTGTQRLFNFSYKLFYAIQTGGLVVVDELGSNIHPNITRAIIRMFQSEKINPKRAQLIFTSHDNTLQRANLLRRDQIWFTQKRPDGSTELYPLSDFRPRNDLAIDKAYLDGRFGAVPILPDEEEILQLVESSK